ncbi:hypothetical protein ACSBR1_036118 [Camellia fascicularis]
MVVGLGKERKTCGKPGCGKMLGDKVVVRLWRRRWWIDKGKRITILAEVKKGMGDSGYGLEKKMMGACELDEEEIEIGFQIRMCYGEGIEMEVGELVLEISPLA